MLKRQAELAIMYQEQKKLRKLQKNREEKQRVRERKVKKAVNLSEN